MAVCSRDNHILSILHSILIFFISFHILSGILQNPDKAGIDPHCGHLHEQLYISQKKRRKNTTRSLVFTNHWIVWIAWPLVCGPRWTWKNGILLCHLCMLPFSIVCYTCLSIWLSITFFVTTCLRRWHPSSFELLLGFWFSIYRTWYWTFNIILKTTVTTSVALKPDGDSIKCCNLHLKKIWCDRVGLCIDAVSVFPKTPL